MDPTTHITMSERSYHEATSRSATKGRKEIFNNVLHTFYLWLYGVGQIVKDYTYSER